MTSTSRQVIACFLITALVMGCRSVPHANDYLPEYARTHPVEAREINIQNDAMDIVAISFEFPALGAKGIVGPVEVGLFMNGAEVRGGGIRADGVGVRSGYTSYDSVENVFIIGLASGNKFYGKDRAYLRKTATGDYTLGRIGGEVGVCLGFRFEINPLEFLDFLTGLIGFDLLEDDVATPFKDPMQVKLLHYSGLNLKEVPPGFNIYKNLNYLRLNNNKLVSIPETFGDFTHLTTLDISSNRVKSLPFSFSSLKELESLDVAENEGLEVGNRLCGLTNLKHLDMAMTDLKEFPDIYCLRQLRKLDLSNNPIRTLPSLIGQLRSLEELDLFFTELEKLPDEIGDLTELQRLNLETKTQEPVHPVASIRKLTKLRMVKVGAFGKGSQRNEEQRAILFAEWKSVLPPDCVLLAH